MKTPALYVQNLNNHIITTDMLANCLYSSNKRAKIGETKKGNIDIKSYVILIGVISTTTRRKRRRKRKAITNKKKSCCQF